MLSLDQKGISTLNKGLMECFFACNIQDLILMIFIHISMVSLEAQKLGLGAWDPM